MMCVVHLNYQVLLLKENNVITVNGKSLKEYQLLPYLKKERTTLLRRESIFKKLSKGVPGPLAK